MATFCSWRGTADLRREVRTVVPLGMRLAPRRRGPKGLRSAGGALRATSPATATWSWAVRAADLQPALLRRSRVYAKTKASPGPARSARP